MEKGMDNRADNQVENQRETRVLAGLYWDAYGNTGKDSGNYQIIWDIQIPSSIPLNK